MNKAQVCAPDKCGGITIFAGFKQTNGTVELEMDFQNGGQVPITSLAIQLNKNAFGLAPAVQQITFNPPVLPGSTGSHTIPLNVSPAALQPVVAGQPASPVVQAAIKNMATGGVFYFAANFNIEALFGGGGAQAAQDFINMWKGIDATKEIKSTGERANMK